MSGAVEIPLAGRRGVGFVATVDSADAEIITSRSWWPVWSPNAPLPYAWSYLGSGREGRRQIRMHRLILGAVGDQIVDHVNGNPLDNRRENLRIATPTQNSANRHRRGRVSASGFLGVYPDGDAWWYAQVSVGSRRKYIGRFSNPVDAARARDEYAKEAFGSFAVLNFPEAR